MGLNLVGKTEIVLPKAESTPEFAFEGGTPLASAQVTRSAAVAPTITESPPPPANSFSSPEYAITSINGRLAVTRS